MRCATALHSADDRVDGMAFAGPATPHLLAANRTTFNTKCENRQASPWTRARPSRGLWPAGGTRCAGPAELGRTSPAERMQPTMASQPPPETPDVLVIGGGVAGLSTALEIAMEGATVKVLSRAPDESAVRAAAGMLGLNTEQFASGPFYDLALASRNMYPEYVATLERIAAVDVGYISCGDFLVPLRSNEEAPESVRENGTWMSGDVLHTIEPMLASDITAGYQLRTDAHLDNRSLYTALQKACAVLGVQIELGANATRVVATPDGRAVHHVRLSSGESITAKHYVVTAGAWTQQLLPNIPMKPIKGQMLCLEPRIARTSSLAAMQDMERLQHTIYGDVYIVPKQGGRRVFVGATVEDVGFDRETTAGAMSSLLAQAIKYIPAFEDYHVAETWAGLRPAAPDRQPIVGASQFDNMTLNTGFFRNGILLAPATARIAALTALGRQDQLPESLSPLADHFSYRRFETMEEPAGATKPQRRPHVQSTSTRSASTAPVKPQGEDDILLYRILPDGSKLPVKRGQSFSIFSSTAGDTKPTDPVMKNGEDTTTPPPMVNRRSINEPSSEEPQDSTDGYADLMKLGASTEADSKMREARAKIRAFGRGPSPVRGTEISTSQSEWNRYEEVFKEADIEAEKLRQEIDAMLEAKKNRTDAGISA